MEIRVLYYFLTIVHKKKKDAIGILFHHLFFCQVTSEVLFRNFL